MRRNAWTLPLPRVSPGVVFASIGQGGGSGFLIDADGDIVTNHHVVDEVEAVVRDGSDDRTVRAPLGDRPKEAVQP